MSKGGVGGGGTREEERERARGERGRRGWGRDEGGWGGAGGAKSRTQLTNMGKIPANEDGRSSGDLVGWGCGWGGL